MKILLLKLSKLKTKNRQAVNNLSTTQLLLKTKNKLKIYVMKNN